MRRGDAVQFAIIKVHDADSCDSDGESNDDKDMTKQERGVPAFLEDENGNVISYQEKRRLYSELRGFWNDTINPNCPPNNWSSAGTTLREKFRDIIEDKFPFLRLCAGRWKVDALWKKNYHSWKRSLSDRQSRKTPLTGSTGDSNDGGKGKRKESPEPADPHVEPDESLDGPRRKKVKAGTGPLPTMGQSQKVCQLPADTHSIIRKGQSEQSEMQGLPIVSDVSLVYFVFLPRVMPPSQSLLIGFFSVQLNLKMPRLTQRSVSYCFTSPR